MTGAWTRIELVPPLAAVLRGPEAQPTGRQLLASFLVLLLWSLSQVLYFPVFKAEVRFPPVSKFILDRFQPE